jgi:ribonuclease E
MLDSEPTGPNGAASDGDAQGPDQTSPAAPTPRRRRAASRPAGPPQPAAAMTAAPQPGAPAEPAEPVAEVAPEAAPEVAPAPRKRTRKAAAKAEPAPEAAAEPPAEAAAEPAAPPAPARKRTRKAAPVVDPFAATPPAVAEPAITEPAAEQPAAPTTRRRRAAAPSVPALFQAPEPVPVEELEEEAEEPVEGITAAEAEPEGELEVEAEGEAEGEETGEGPRRKRRRRGGRGRRRKPGGETGEAGSGEEPGEGAEPPTAEGAVVEASPSADADTEEGETGSSATRRRRRRRRGSSAESEPEGVLGPDDPERTVVHVREPRKRAESDTAAAVRGSTRLEAKKQRRREGREAGRRRPPVLTEAEFLARRESVDRVMVVRQRGDLTQIAVLEDNVLVEHYVASASSSTMVGNVYLGKVQNVLPSMEAAFVDIGRGRNAVLYAGEVNWDAAGLADGQPRRIEHALKSGDSVLVQVTKDPIGHKGSRLTANISLAGRFLVYVPDGSMSGISRKLPDTERARLKGILKSVVPDDAGVIVRTAAEGATEEQLTRDVSRLQAQWEDIAKKAKTASAPTALYSEPDLTIRVIRDLFNEDFARLIVAGDDAWDVVEAYVGHVAPELMERAERYQGEDDVFAAYRIDEQIAKGLDRKVWLPSGGSLVIDRTEAMTVVDVNTGKFTGKGSGNLEETVTQNNLEAAEEIVRQLRLRDIGGIIVIDFIDMVLETNRELVLRRLTECLGRDRTKHQVAEVTSLGLVQMTRKRIGQGLVEAFSEPCPHCGGRGILTHLEPVETKAAPRAEEPPEAPRRRRRGKKETGPEAAAG